MYKFILILDKFFLEHEGKERGRGGGQIDHPLEKTTLKMSNFIRVKFNRVHSRNNLSKIKGGAYLVNFDEYEPIGTHWIPLYVNYKNVTYFWSWTYLKKKLKNSLGIKTLSRIFIEYKPTIQ